MKESGLSRIPLQSQLIECLAGLRDWGTAGSEARKCQHFHGMLCDSRFTQSHLWILSLGFPSEQLWTSPELLRHDSAAPLGTKPGDVYAFAIIMHEVFYQTRPYGPADTSVGEILELVMGEENPPFRPQGSRWPIRTFLHEHGRKILI
ncbi:Receptor-type guanylate cyclase gcy-28 [Taenia crassiceps]|uniref:Receptor-type guanylate cyclase gcy-28 n=1 Tax=Taenia crassiceps TaxID=6207 RepID=A0ABR4PZF6_9CEST